METFGQRLKYFREEMRLTQSEFAEKLGYGTTQTMISKWERINKKVYLAKNLVLIKKAFPQLNDDWLSSGIGEYKPQPKTYTFEELTPPKVNESTVEYLKTIIEQKDKIISLQEQLLKAKDKDKES